MHAHTVYLGNNRLWHATAENKHHIGNVYALVFYNAAQTIQYIMAPDVFGIGEDLPFLTKAPS